MRILVIADKIPSYRLGDGLRLTGLLTPLVVRHSFDLLCFSRSAEVVEQRVADLFASIAMLPFPQSSPKRMRRLSRAFSLDGFKGQSPEMRDRISGALSSGRYDLLLDVSASMLLSLPEPELPVPLIVDSIDEPLLRDLRALLHEPLRAPRLMWQLMMYWRYERSHLRRASLNLYASEVDADFYRRLFPGRRVAVVPNGVDLEYFSPSQRAARDTDANLIVFEGNMMFPPNIDAAKRLCKEVLPIVRVRHPRARVCLVGRDPVPEVRALAGPDVEVTGTVPDVRPHLARAAAFACPMRLGSGIKNKLLQAWAMSLPVVATAQSVGGIDARDGENVLIRDSSTAIANALADLMADRARAAALGAAGRRTVEEHFSWDQSAMAFEKALMDVSRFNASYLSNA